MDYFNCPLPLIYIMEQIKKAFSVGKNAADTFYFSSAKKPDLINVDADKVLLAEKKEQKPLKNIYTNLNMVDTI